MKSETVRRHMESVSQYRQLVKELAAIEQRAMECARAAIPAYGRACREGDCFIVDELQEDIVLVSCTDRHGKHVIHIAVPSNVIAGESSRTDWVNELVIIENQRRVEADEEGHKKLVAEAKVRLKDAQRFLGKEQEMPDTCGAFASDIKNKKRR